MTKKDFELIARTLDNAAPLSDERIKQWLRDCRMLADALATTNPRFDRAKFLAACGVAS